VACGAKKWKAARELVVKELRDADLSEKRAAQMEQFMPQRPAEEVCRHILAYLTQE